MSHLLANFADVSDVSEGAAAELRHFAGEEKIRSAADGHRIESRAAQVRTQRRKDLLFIAEVTVGQQDDVAQVAGEFGLLHHVKKRRQHISAAACFQVLHEAAPRCDVVRTRRERLG